MTQPTAAAAGCQADVPCHRPATIVAHERVADHTWRIRLDCPEIAGHATPGQFAMLRIPGRSDPLLARPLAVYDVFAVDGRPRHVDFIYLVHGRFTTALTSLRPGDELAIWGPLGNGFRLPPVDHLVLVAGGIGQTALLALARERLGGARYGSGSHASAPARRVTFCWGARHAGMFADVDDFRAAGCNVHLATLDGSTGTRGTIIDLLDARFTADLDAATTHVACCGPEPMMAAVARWSADRGVPCAVSLETPMACGIGICFTCVAPIRDADGGWDYLRTCVEGPIFDAATVVW